MNNYPLEELPEAIVLWKEDGIWVIRHEETGITTQGNSRIHALLMLADALRENSDDDILTLADDVFTSDDAHRLRGEIEDST